MTGETRVVIGDAPQTGGERWVSPTRLLFFAGVGPAWAYFVTFAMSPMEETNDKRNRQC